MRLAYTAYTNAYRLPGTNMQQRKLAPMLAHSNATANLCGKAFAGVFQGTGKRLESTVCVCGKNVPPLFSWEKSWCLQADGTETLKWWRQHHGTSRPRPGLPTRGPWKAAARKRFTVSCVSPKSKCLRNMAPNSDGSRVFLVPTGALNWNTSEFIAAQEFNTTHCHIVRCQHRETRFWELPTFSNFSIISCWGEDCEVPRSTIWDAYWFQPFPWDLGDVSFWVPYPFQTHQKFPLTTWHLPPQKCDSHATSSFCIAFGSLGFFSTATFPAFKHHQPCTLLQSAPQIQLNIGLGFRVVPLERRNFKNCWILRTSTNLSWVASSLRAHLPRGLFVQSVASV